MRTISTPGTMRTVIDATTSPRASFSLTLLRTMSRTWTAMPELARERPRPLEVFRLERVQPPVSQRADGVGGVWAGVLREGARADDEHVRHVPALQVAVHGAGGRIVAHHRAAGVVRALVGNDGVLADARVDVHLRRPDRLAELGRLVGDVLRHLGFVLVAVEGHAQRREGRSHAGGVGPCGGGSA